MTTGTEGAVRGPVRVELDAIGFVPTASKLYRPTPGLVPRSTLVEHVGKQGGDVITVTGPAGYGKSTFLAELAAADARPAAWVSLTAAENDPAALLTYVALALDQIEPVDAACVTALWSRPPSIGSPTLQRFGAMMAGRRVPFTLVLDDVHALVERAALDILPMLVAELPVGSRIVFAARTAVPLPLGRLRVRRRVVEVGPAELAFDEAEAALFLRQLDVEADAAETARLVERTEGWPMALYLAALAHGSRGDGTVLDDFTGEHRYLVDFLAEEMLDELDPDVATFLMEASCLERMSGELCDDVLERRGSARLLDELQHRNLLVIPVDDRRRAYRFHHLFAEFLQAELARRDPARRPAIHRRASEWYDAHRDGDAAVTHAVRAGDVARAETMVMRWYGAIATAGRLYPTTARWAAQFLDAFGRHPQMMIIAALASLSAGDPTGLQALAGAAALLPDLHPPDVHGFVAPVALALARSMYAPLSPHEMASEAAYVHDHVGRGDGYPASCLTSGAAAFMLGDAAEAQRWLRRGAESGLDRPLIEASCRAHLALIDIERSRWDEAASHARRARALLGEASSAPANVMAVAVHVLVETQAGRADQAEADRQLCRDHLTRLVAMAPWLNLQARVALARAAVIRGDRVEAAALVEEAEGILETTPGAVRVEEQLAGLRRETATRDRSQTFGPSSLTTAELRVLQLLPTHLSVGEIADRLYVSRNTVKSQTISIYRKLGTSSRSGAVAVAAEAGLLPAPGRT